ncbi:selenide, water dikinase SelD [Acidobacteriota bacterium]
MADPEKRKIVMGRSRRLGHCICNPKLPCPCDILKEKNVCLCAGERLPDAPDDVQLTHYVESAGCASKINQSDLKIAMAGLPQISDPKVLVSSDTCDDAGVYQLNDDLALVQSVDVFTPNVDDAYTFGQIAAANSVSDIYAMGGTPLTALSIIGFPIEELSHKIMNQMLLGGVDKMKEAGVVVIGGHSIKDKEIKFGFSVTGVINPQKIVTNDRAQPGDALILTKSLGTGIISFARQLDQAFPFNIAAISKSMAELNRAASQAMVEMGLTTATDVTGFGLLGHLAEIVVQSGVTAEIYTESIPVFDDVFLFIEKELISGAVERNREYASQYVAKEDGVSAAWETVLYDPQTSGGLLIAVSKDKSQTLISLLKEKDVDTVSIIGEIIDKSEGKIILKKNS